MYATPYNFLLILLNPTLSLSSLVIGYESLTASGFIVMFTIIIKDLLEKNNKYFYSYKFHEMKKLLLSFAENKTICPTEISYIKLLKI